MLTRMIMIIIIMIFQDNHDHHNWLVSREVEEGGGKRAMALLSEN